ncbi:MAG: LysR family transcriptional regulator [bacterium]|nr:LysR family transcriptional regulator [bacterium]
MLSVLEALYLYKSTTLAAEKTGLAQPSISWYLKQLRELTGDELFIRSTKCLEPTDFCTAYYLQVKDILNALDVLRNSRGKVFNPEVQAVQFSIAIPYFKARMILESLSVNLMNRYPLIESNLLYLREAEAIEHLESGRLDLYIGLVTEKLPKQFSVEKVLESEFVVLCSEKSPLYKKGKITKRDFVDTPHIKLAPSFEPSMLDMKLKKQGLLQKTLLSVPDIGSELILLQEGAYMLMIDKQDAGVFMPGNTFKIMQTDFKLPQLPLYAVWHRRKKADSAHSWLREYLKKDCKAYNDGRRPGPKRFKV